ncbi:MAG: hypothetical protein DLM72_05685 [Candidatus Nitrosopolaris wilkensis]|nr:MAG: hypothetical protein DLM72_05685 [Candidatus Nitrosopolaris wilkensis]
MVQNIMIVNQLQLVYQTIEGIQFILAECWKKYNDPKLEERDKISYLRLTKDCNKVIEEMDNLRQKNYHGSGST